MNVQTCAHLWCMIRVCQILNIYIKYVFSVYGILLDGLHCIYSRYIQNTIFYIYYILLICTHLQTFKNILHLYTI